MQHLITRVLIIAVGVSVHAGCAGLARKSSSNRFMVNRAAGPVEMKPENDRPARPETPPEPTLEEAIGKMRRLMTEARPEKKTAASTSLEATDPNLVAALAVATTMPTAETYLEVAHAYYRKQVLDRAYDYYTRSLGLKPRQAEVYEGLARVWRDWGMPALALGDVYRAIYYEPASASARNTLGTILQAVGQRKLARIAYMEVLALAPKSAYAFNNLCYLSFLDGDAHRAIDECRVALRLDPSLTAARNNLGLTYAAAGRLDLARREFELAGGTAAGAYNMGIVHLAGQQFAAAAGEFRAAQVIRSGFAEAGRRALDAGRRAAAAAHSDTRSIRWPQ